MKIFIDGDGCPAIDLTISMAKLWLRVYYNLRYCSFYRAR